jgi:hypothetical protein
MRRRARMMRGVLEDSVEGFVARFRSSAAEVTLSGRVEGNPLLECLVAGVAIHVFERTGPYLAWSGPARVILNLECDELEPVDARAPDADGRIDVVGVSALMIDGIVLARDEPFLVVDAGAPFVVGMTGDFPEVGVGHRVRVVSRAPIHAFVLPRPAVRPTAAASADDQV